MPERARTRSDVRRRPRVPWLGLLGKGMYEESGPEFGKAATTYGKDIDAGLAVVYAATGKKGEALRILNLARRRSRHGEIAP